jgi:hypothetical protein
MIVHYLDHEDERARLARECQEKARRFNYDDAVAVLDSAVGSGP